MSLFVARIKGFVLIQRFDGTACEQGFEIEIPAAVCWGICGVY